MKRSLFWLAALWPLGPLAAQPAAEPATVRGLSAVQLFDVADQIIAQGDVPAASAIYEALTNDPDPYVRSEARFRHGKLMAARGKLAEAAVLFRAILDEKPDAQRVRLELAAVLARMGDMRAAGRELRQAQAGGLPPEVAQLVSQYTAALRSFRPFGGSLELALAPSTNINRATSDTTLDTIIAPFELSRDARARSGLGIKLGGQGYFKLPVSPSLLVTGRVAGQGLLYRRSQFDEALTNAQLGLEARLGKVRLTPQIGRSYRWFGGNLYATTDTASLSVTKGLGKQSLLEVEGAVGRANYRANDLQDGSIYDASVRFEHAFSARSGGAVTLTGQRQVARDPGFSTVLGGASLLGWREAGKMTLYATAGLYRLEADKRLFLYPRRREEWLIRAGAGATLRQLSFRGFAPVLRVSYERNSSSVGIYDYRRFTTEVGLTRAF